MATLREKQYVIGGRPRLVLAGEVHYFRLARSDWHDRIRKARQANCNAIASYIPWLYHEEIEGDVDVDGRRAAERDVGAFIDLCRAEGLWFIARPGPFVMGEVKNEGIPNWVYDRRPEAVPVTWGGRRATSKNLNYLDEGFLSYVDRWYAAIMPVLAPRLDPDGNVIAVQLDNEIGMLQCWTEEADLSDSTLCDFAEWAVAHRPKEWLEEAYPFDLGDPEARVRHLREGNRQTARFFHRDYTEFTRHRFARYAAFLRASAEKHGVRDVPFIINIHGSGGGRATTFPIGISQTYRAYSQAEGFWGSSDHYLGELTRENAPDLYVLNAFMAAVNRPEQPLSSVEFEAGTGDYGESAAMRYSGAAADFKARLSVVQGNRMLNHYLLAGGFNPMLRRPKDDGNSRVGTTGERHGFAAPINPEGRLDPVYFALADTNRTLLAVQELLAEGREDVDDVAIGFVPDYYSTDVKPAGPMRDLAGKLEAARGSLESLARGMLELGFSFTGVDLQSEISQGLRGICLGTAQVLAADVQSRLLEFVRNGGRLFLYGRIPQEDMEGRPCRILCEGLGITPRPYLQGSPDFFPSLQGESFAQGEPEVRAWQVEPFVAESHRPFLRVVQRRSAAGSILDVGNGKVCLATAELHAHPPLWRGIFEALDLRPKLAHDCSIGGVLIQRVQVPGGGAFLSLINLDSEDKTLRPTLRGRPIFPGSVALEGRRAKLLPVEVAVQGVPVAYATTEIVDAAPGRLRFRRTGAPENVALRARATIDRKHGEAIEGSAERTLIRIHPGRGDAEIRIQD